MTAIHWYATDKALAATDRGQVGLPSALEIVDGYFKSMRPHYDSGEEALAATLFSFGRADDDFIEICLHAADRIAVRVELPPPGRFRGPFQAEMELASVDELRHYLTAYFTMDRDKFRAHVEHAPVRGKK